MNTPTLNQPLPSVMDRSRVDLKLVRQLCKWLFATYRSKHHLGLADRDIPLETAFVNMFSSLEAEKNTIQLLTHVSQTFLFFLCTPLSFYTLNLYISQLNPNNVHKEEIFFDT